jgi:hypothetical protein
MNLNLHANLLTALLKLAGMEPTIDGLNIAPMLPFKRFALKTPVIQLKVGDREIQGSYTPQTSGELTLRVRLPEHWSKKGVKCFVDENAAPVELTDGQTCAEIRIHSTRRGFRFRLEQSPLRNGRESR